MSRENVEVLRSAHAAFTRGDLEALKEFIAEDVEWGTTGVWPGIESVYRGPDALVRWGQDLRSVWEFFEVAIDEVLAKSTDSVVIAERLNARGSGSGAEVRMKTYAAYWFREGRVFRRKAFTDKRPALEAVGLRE